MRKLLTLLAMVVTLCANAQQSHLFTSDYDLSSTLINKVLYDSRGYIWVATDDGLNRFDGNKFTVYRHIPGDSTSLNTNFVHTIFEDSQGHLLVDTYQGVQIYNPKTDSFSPLSSDDRNTPINLAISQIIERHDGSLILAGVYLVEARVNEDQHLRLSRILLDASANNGFSNVIEDHDGNLWFWIEHKGAGRLSPDEQVTYFMKEANDPEITSWAIGLDGTVYAGTRSNGLYKYDNQANDFVPVCPQPGMQCSIHTLYVDEEGKVIIGTDGQGVKMYLPGGHEIISFPEQRPGSSRMKVHDITKDEYGNLWLGIYQKGLMLVPAKTNAFHNIGSRAPIDKNLIGDACITAVYRDRNENLWVGTDNDGFYKLNPELSSSRHFTGEGYPATITQFYHDMQHRMWVLSYDRGIGQINDKGQYIPLKVVHKGREVNSFFDIHQDSGGLIWLASMGQGLFTYNPDTREIRHVEAEGDYNPWITCMVVDSDHDTVYFGTYNGLYLLKDGKVKQLINDNIITSIYPTCQGDVWAASVNGFIHADENGVIKTYLEADGLPSNMVHAIEWDGDQLWLSTNMGLSHFDPNTETFTNYTVADGLQGNEFYKNAACHDGATGQLFFGGLNGITYFKPSEISEIAPPGEIRIANFYVGGEPVHASTYSNGRLVTDKAISDTEIFHLGPGENFFSIDFGLRQSFTPSNPTFLYSIDKGEWQKMPKQISPIAGGNRLSFSKLSPGKHTLSLKAVLNSQESEVKTIVIDIAPMWYQTWWAWVLYCLIFFGILWLLWWQYRLRQQRKLEQQQHEHETEIKEAKLQFFTNVSHEIKTPMTLVMSPVEQLLAEDKDPQRQSRYRMILRNSKRVMRLVNEIMDLRKIDNHQMKISYTHINLVGFLQDLYSTFVPAAEKKGIEFTFTYANCENVEGDIDLTNLDKVVMNLLSNALKYTPDGGKVNLNLEVFERDHKPWAQISVTDTGIGVPDTEKAHIFERFYRVANNNASGTGIGLHLAYKLMELQGGSLKVVDNPQGQGSKFMADLPIQADAKAKPYAPESHTQPTSHEFEPQLYADDQDTTVTRTRKEALIYIAEDDKEISDYLKNNLGPEYRIMQFANGEDALKAIQKQAPDLLITDVMMPKMDGLELTRRLRANILCNSLPIIMLTAKTKEQDIIEGLEHGADEYLPKPFNLAILRKRVENLLDQRQRLRNVYAGSQNQAEKVEMEVPKSHDEELMARVMKVINNNLSNSEITIEWIAQEVGISRVHLHRKLKEITNQTTRDFVRNIRLQKAAEILKESHINVSEVSDLVGFKNPNNFSTAFKELYGITPSEYAKRSTSAS